MNNRGAAWYSQRRSVDALTIRAVLAVVLMGAGVLAPVWSVLAAMLVNGSPADMLAGGLAAGMLAIFVAMVVAP